MLEVINNHKYLIKLLVYFKNEYILIFFILASYNIVVGCPTAIIQKHKMKKTQVVIPYQWSKLRTQRVFCNDIKYKDVIWIP